MTLLFGLACKTFIFTPAAAASAAPVRGFDPATASLRETLWYNVWGFSERAKVVVKRTAVVVLLSTVNTSLQTLVTVKGVQARGALAYAGVWAVAAGVAGVVLGVVGAV